MNFSIRSQAIFFLLSVGESVIMQSGEEKVNVLYVIIYWYKQYLCMLGVYFILYEFSSDFP